MRYDVDVEVVTVTEAQRLNQILMDESPGVWAMMSALGKRAAFPRGIPFQSAEAKGVALNATIGQVTDGHGQAMPLDVLSEQHPGANPEETYLYLPVSGPVKLRQRWLERQVRMAGGVGNCSLPIAVHGLTHGVSLAERRWPFEREMCGWPGSQRRNQEARGSQTVAPRTL